MGGSSAGEGPVNYNLGKGSLIQIPTRFHSSLWNMAQLCGLDFFQMHAAGEIAGIELVAKNDLSGTQQEVELEITHK